MYLNARKDLNSFSYVSYITSMLDAEYKNKLLTI